MITRRGSTMSYGRGPCIVQAARFFHHVFRNTVTRESCRKLTDWNSASRYNGYSAWIDRSGSRPPPTRMHTPGAHTRVVRSSLKSFSARATYMVRERVFHPRTELPAPWARIRARFAYATVTFPRLSDIRVAFEDFLSMGKKMVGPFNPCCANKRNFQIYEFLASCMWRQSLLKYLDNAV